LSVSSFKNYFDDDVIVRNVNSNDVTVTKIITRIILIKMISKNNDHTIRHDKNNYDNNSDNYNKNGDEKSQEQIFINENDNDSCWY
jgi:hypothetical protein